MRPFLLYIVILIIFFIQACKSLRTDVKVAERPVPSSYGAVNDTVNIAQLNWRNYFADTFLVQLIDTALQNNFDLKIALQKIESQRADIVQTKGALFPKVGAAANAGITKYGEYTMDGAGNKVTEITPGQIIPTQLPDLSLGLKASWEIDVWRKLRNKRGAAYSRYLETIEAKKYIVTNLIADVATTYYELLSADNELDILQLTLTKQEAALEVIKEQKEAGKANELAVQQFVSQVLNSKAMALEIKQRIVIYENRLNNLLGRYPQTIQRRKDLLFKELPVAIKSGIPSQLLINRPDLQLAELEVRATKYDLKSARAAFYPSFNIFAGLGFQAFDPAYLFVSPASLAYSALGSLTAPLINQSALRSQFQKAKASQIQSLYNYQKSVLNAYVEVVNDLSNVSKLQEMATIKRSQAEVSLQSVEISTELYRSAKAGYLEVLLAQQYALRSNLDLVEVNKRLKGATINIYRDLGGGWR